MTLPPFIYLRHVTYRPGERVIPPPLISVSNWFLNSTILNAGHMEENQFLCQAKNSEKQGFLIWRKEQRLLVLVTRVSNEETFVSVFCPPPVVRRRPGKETDISIEQSFPLPSITGKGNRHRAPTPSPPSLLNKGRRPGGQVKINLYHPLTPSLKNREGEPVLRPHIISSFPFE